MSGADYWAGLPPEQDRPADVREVGVGPWPGGEAAWPTDPRYDGAVHVVGRRRWNKRGAMVTNRYLDVRHHPEPSGLLTWAAEAGYEPIAIDNGPGSLQLEHAQLPERCLLVFGSEGEGISEELRAGCTRLLRIGQYGSTRSINVAAAAAIAMHTWVLQHAGPAPD